MMPKVEKLLFGIVKIHRHFILHQSVTRCCPSLTWSRYRHLKSGLRHGQRETTVHEIRHFRSSAAVLHSESDTEDPLYNDPSYKYVKEICSIPDSGHRVFVIQPDFKLRTAKPHLSSADLKLDETCTLIKTLPRWHVVGKMTIPVKSTSVSDLFPSHTLSRLTSRIVSMSGVSAVVIGVDVLQPGQLTVLQNAWEVPIFDRFTIVLQIFKDHAKTREAKLQVALAEIPYIRSRLSEVSAGRHDRQTGGAQHIGGTGETWLQVRKKLLQENAYKSPKEDVYSIDLKPLQERELKLRLALTDVKKQRSLLRKNRQKKKIPTVAVVGYTNAGKTSLIRALTSDPSLHPSDQLFATLDVTSHAGSLPNRMSVLFLDTVGFLSDIPILLIDAFNATLEDAVLADVIVNVCDRSHPDWQSQRQTVVTTLRSMLSQKQMDSVIEVWNKADIAPESRKSECIRVSATTGQGMDALRELLQQKLLGATQYMEKTFRVPMSGEHLGWLYKNSTVTDAQPDDTNVEYLHVNVIIDQAAYSRFKIKFSKCL